MLSDEDQLLEDLKAAGGQLVGGLMDERREVAAHALAAKGLVRLATFVTASKEPPHGLIAKVELV